ncbi:MAG: MFS transporter, partial [Cyanobacteria bacterium P01_F01_bin.42]
TKTKIGYGIGEFSKEIPGSIMVFFLLYFLTNVVGLPPSLAGTTLMIGRVWDAVNDPLIGWLSDRTRSPLGRRFPWMLGGAVPLGLSFWLLWQTPSFSEQWQQFGYYTGVMLALFGALTAVAIPHSSLGAELTETYDQRTQLMSFKAAFSIASSILGLVIAQVVFSLALEQSQQYFILGAAVGLIVVLTAVICVWMTFQRYRQVEAQRSQHRAPASLSIWQELKTALRLRPFLIVIGIYLCSWMGLQTTAGIMQYYVVDYLRLDNQSFTLMILVIQGTALTMMLFWSKVAQRLGKRVVYCSGLPLTIAAQIGLALLQPQSLLPLYTLGVLAGVGLSTAYLIPWSMLPDVIDLDELKTGQRREGIFCGIVVQMQKFSTALTIFLVGLLLEWSGYVPNGGAEALQQPESAILAIRWLVGPIPALILVLGIAIATTYPITRDRHRDIVRRLQQRQSAS